MKILSAVLQTEDGNSRTMARPITPEDAEQEQSVRNALDAMVRETSGRIVSYQIITPGPTPHVLETTLGGAEGDVGLQVGVQHPDAVGIVDGEPSGDDPFEGVESDDLDVPEPDDIELGAKKRRK